VARAIAFEHLKGTGFSPYVHALINRGASAPEGRESVSELDFLMELAPNEILKSVAKWSNGCNSGAKALLDLLFSCTG